MSALFSTPSPQRKGLQEHCLMDSKLTSFEYSHFPATMMYLNPPSTVAPASHPELFSPSSLPGHDYIDCTSSQNKDEMVFFAPRDRQLDVAPSVLDSNEATMDTEVFTKELLHLKNGNPHLQREGFSLSLGNQVLSSAKMASYESPCINSGVPSLLSSHAEHSSDRRSHSIDLKAAEYFSFDSSESSGNMLNAGLLRNRTSSSPPNENSSGNLKEEMIIDRMMCNSKYLKVAQELLNELVNVHQCLNPPTKKRLYFQSYGHDGSEKTKQKCSRRSILSLNPQNATTVSSGEVSPVLQNDLHNKMTKLLSLLDEVEWKYKHYYQQMKHVVSSFEIMAGFGAARCYTALASQTISCQFRHLHDAIKRQIQVVQQSLGEQGTLSNVRAGLSRLKYVDQQVRQERALQQFGVVRQPWRPQRGLPETAVSVLRAWLFEHFLHPYPKDSEKIMLARQAGLTRSQVANWFINARVRLWKPMIEEMYNEEFSNLDADFKSSSESPQGAEKLKSESEDTGEELRESFTTTVVVDGHPGKSNESRNSIVSDLEPNGYAAHLSFQRGGQKVDKMGFEFNTSWKDEIVDITGQSNMTANQSINRPVDTYNLSVLGGVVEDHVSLALGLPSSLNDKKGQFYTYEHSAYTGSLNLHYSSNDTVPIFGATRSGENETAAASAALDNVDYFCIDHVNQQDRFYNPHVLSHFVV